MTSIGPVSISAGSEPILAKARTRARGFRPVFFASGFVADQNRRGAVDDARGIAGMMDVIDVFDFRMRLDGDRIEAAHFTHLHERRLAATPSDCMVVSGRMCSSLSRMVRPLTSFTAIDRAVEAAIVPRRRGALLAFDRVGVDVVARKSVFGRDQVGGNALRHEVMRDRDRRIDRPGAAGRADADAAHRFDAAADRHVLLSGHDLRGGEIHRVEAGRTEAVDLHAGHAVAIAGDQRRVRAISAPASPTGSTHAQDHVVDQSGIELVAVLDGAERLAREIERGHFVQRAVDLAAAARGAHVIVDEGVGHDFPPWLHWASI